MVATSSEDKLEKVKTLYLRTNIAGEREAAKQALIRLGITDFTDLDKQKEIRKPSTVKNTTKVKINEGVYIFNYLKSLGYIGNSISPSFTMYHFGTYRIVVDTYRPYWYIYTSALDQLSGRHRYSGTNFNEFKKIFDKL